MTLELRAPPNQSLWTYFDMACEGAGDDVAVRGPFGKVRYSDLRERSLRWAAVLDAKLGHAGTGVVAVRCTDDAAFVSLVLGASAAGVVFCPLSRHLSRVDLARVIRAIRPGLIVGNGGTWSGIADGAPGDEAAWDPVPGAVRAPAGELASAIFLTSGTRAMRAVLHSNNSLCRSIRAVGELPGMTHVRQKWLLPLPLDALGGFAVLCRALAQGDEVVLPTLFSPRTMLNLIENHDVTHAVFAPSMLQIIVRMTDGRRRDFSTLSVVGTGSAPLADDVAARASETFGAIVADGYGTTELGGPVMLRVAGAGGFTPVPTAAVTIFESQEVGALLCCVDSPALGYVDETGIVPIPAVGKWIRTGDLARQLPTGDFEIVGREDDLVIRNGRKVLPGEVEDAARQHGAVVEVAAVKFQERGSDRLCLCVERRENSDLQTEELAAFLANRLAKFKLPNRYFISDRLPRTASGKVRRSDLAEQLGSIRGR